MEANIQAPGTYYVEVRGAFDTVTGSYTLHIDGPPPDTTLPTVAISSPTAGQVFTTLPITVSGTATDPGSPSSGVTLVEVRVNAGSWQTATGTTSWSKTGLTLSSGSNTIEARSKDTAGNYSALTSVSVTYNPPDTTAPTVAIASPTAGQVSTASPITVSGTATDPGNPSSGVALVEARVNAGSWQTATGATTWNKTGLTLSSGSNTIEARSKDTAGNYSAIASVSVTYNPPDTTAPTVAITSPTAGQVFTVSSIAVSGSATDPGSPSSGVALVEVRVNAGSWQTATGTTSWSKTGVTLSSGSNTIEARSKDTAGNYSAIASVSVTYNPPDTTASITVTTPNGGETWYAGNTYPIGWTYTGDPGAQVKITLLKADKLVKTIKSATSTIKGSFIWAIPTAQTPGDDYKIKVVSTTKGSCLDVSDNVFSIKPPQPITVLTPSGGENWKVGSTYTLKWKSTLDIGSAVKVELLKGDTVVQTIATGAPSGSLGTGSCRWKIRNSLAYDADYRIRVTSNTNVSYTDTSDQTFTVSGPKLDVASPDGGERWPRGSQQNITWSYTGNPVGKVKIQLLKAGTSVRTITSGTPIGTGGNGSCPWTIPPDLAAASTYRIKITHTYISGCTATSNANFSITKAMAATSAGPDQKVAKAEQVVLSGANSIGFDKEKATFLWNQLDGPETKISDPTAVTPAFNAPDAVGDGESLMFQLTVTGDDGVQSLDSCIVNVAETNSPPIAEAGPTQTVVSNDVVMLDGSGSFDHDDGISTYSWNQIAGPQATLSDSTSVQPTFTAPEAGVNGESLTFQLTVTDQGGLRARDTCIVNVVSVNHPPKAEAGPDRVVQPGAVVVLDGSQSLDPDGNVVSYRWSQSAGQPVSLSDPTAAQTSFMAPSSGSGVEELVFQLLVTDSGGLQDKQKIVVTITGASRTAPK
jgi:hypothetical protein